MGPKELGFHAGAAMFAGSLTPFMWAGAKDDPNAAGLFALTVLYGVVVLAFYWWLSKQATQLVLEAK